MLIIIRCASMHSLNLSPLGSVPIGCTFCSPLAFIPQPLHACRCSLRGGLLLVACFARVFSFFAHVCKCLLFEVFVLLDADPYLLLRRTCASCLLLVCALAPCLWCCCACFRLHLVRCIYSTLNSHLHLFSSHLGHL